MSDYRIPFNRPGLTGREAAYVERLAAAGHFSGDGPFTKACQELLERELGAPKVLLTTSCTHALEMAALLLDIGPGDEVIVPSFTFVSTVNAFVLRGARPVFVDIRADTLNMDERLIADLVSSRTKALVPVHYAGIGCEMDEISRVASAHGITVVEDNALSLFGQYLGRCLGTFGALATQSFHETKSFSCGEGGALLINDTGLIERAEILREKGTDRSRFFRGQVDKYTWVDVGSSYLPSDILAAFLYAQLEARHDILATRRRIWEMYYEALAPWAAGTGVELPTIPRHCTSSYSMFHMVLPSPAARTDVIERLRRAGILAVFHYLPLHLSPMGRRFGGRPEQLPVTERVSERLVRLPFYDQLTEAHQQQVVDLIVST